MSRRMMLVLAASALFASIATLHWNGVRACASSLKKTEKRIRMVSAEVEEHSFLQARVDRLRQLAIQQGSTMSVDLDVAGFLNDLRRDLKDLGVRDHAWNISPAIELGEFQAVAIEVGLEADFGALHELLIRMESYRRIVRFEHLALRSHKDEPAVLATMHVRIFARPGDHASSLSEAIE